MRKTQKYLAGLKTLEKCGLPQTGYTNDELYQTLEDENFYWDGKAKTWVEKKIKPSIFDNPNDGFARIRIMAHPDNLDEIEKKIRSVFGVIEGSKPYPNREDVGQRVYVLVKI